MIDWAREFQQKLDDAMRARGVVNKDGVWWHQAPLPRRWHRCKTWTWSFEVERCACGAIRITGTWWWFERNARRDT